MVSSVLVIDDDPKITQLLRRALGMEGYAVQTASSGTAHRGPREISLSTTEFELLHYFLRHPRRVLSREAILNAVWGAQFERPTNVVEVYVGYLRAKLEAEDESRLIHTVRGAGYVLKEA